MQQVYLDLEKKIEKLRKENSGDHQLMRSVIEEIMQSTDAKIAAFLTDPQKEVYQEIKKERGKGRDFARERLSENN